MNRSENPQMLAARARYSHLRAAIQELEPRRLLSVTVGRPIHDIALNIGSAQVLNLFPSFRDTAAEPVVQFNTTDGNFQVKLFPDRAPRTVDNFIHYISSGLYNNTIIHKSIPGVVVQGGSFDASFDPIPTFGRVINEPGGSNTLGTIGMAKANGQPNSATSEFFINTANNSATFDQQNGGFTVFGQVIGNGMQQVAAINALPTATVNGFSNVPLLHSPPAGAQDFVTIQSASVLPDLTYAVASDNPAIAAASISGSNLTLMSAGAQGTTHVTVTASDTSGHTSSQTFAVTAGTLGVQIGDGGGAHSLSYVDANGVKGTVTMLGGSATLHFAGTNLASSAPRKDAIVLSGSEIRLASIATTGTTGRSALAFKGGAGLAVGSITADAGIGQITAKNVALNGDLSVDGALSRLDLGSISNGTIDINGTIAARPSMLAIGSASDADLVSNSPIRDLANGSWKSPDNASMIIAAPSIAKLTATGDFAAGLDLAQDSAASLGSASIRGTLGDADWRIVGTVGTITAGSVSAGFSGTVSQSLRTFTVRKTFVGASLHASALGKIKIGSIQTANGGVPFGLGAHSLGSLTAQANRKPIKLAGITAANAAKKLAAAGLPLGDFTVTVA